MLFIFSLTDAENDKLTMIFHKYHRFMYKTAYSIVQNPDVAEDVVQTAFCKIIKHSTSISDVHSPQTISFIAMVTKNTAFDYCKKAAHDQRLAKNIIQLATHNTSHLKEDFPEDAICCDTPFSGSLHDFINRLCHEDRMIISLKYANSMADKEIAAIMNLTDATVRKRLSRARIRLKDMITQSKEGGLRND